MDNFPFLSAVGEAGDALPKQVQANSDLFKTQPETGRMTIDMLPGHLPGFEESSRTLEIHFRFKGGVQGSSHPHPGQPFVAQYEAWTAYLPLNEEGKMICELLKLAFSHRRLFHIQQSQVCGEPDFVTMRPVTLKTQKWGGPDGFPDPLYFDRVRAELAALDVSPVDLHPAHGVNWTALFLGPLTYE